MTLSLLLDEQMSPEVAAQIQAKRPEISIHSVQMWRGGALRGVSDERLLRAAKKEGLTLVSYDVSTIMPILAEWGTTGENHAGVIFIDHRTIAQNDLGGQTAAILEHWETTRTWDWTNIVLFLRPATTTK